MELTELFADIKYKANLKPSVVLITLAISLSACTSSKAIRTPVLDSPTVEQARNDRETGSLIRWGGEIVSIENKSDHTLIEIVERPLTRYGTPKASNKSSGRFFAISEQFIDPENVKTGRSLTVSGTVIKYMSGMIGEYDYVYPVVQIKEYKVWPVNSRPRHPNYYSPYWYDPYWGPHSYWHINYRLRHRYRHW